MTKAPAHLIWLGLAAFTLLLYFTADSLPNLLPELAITDWMNAASGWFSETFKPIFRALGWLLEWPIRWARWFLGVLPWSVTLAGFTLLAYVASGWRLAIFACVSLLYMAGIGFWAESMNSLAIVLISVPMAIAVGFGFGVWGFYSTRARKIIMPMLDLMQTIPAFAYLLPILILFGFGTTVGLVASIIYAFPPMVRNTILGLNRVPEDITEAGLMAGATPSQLFWKVRMPAAQNQMLLGVNQTTMASLSMVIIAAIIGGTNDIGWEVLSYMRKAAVGESLLVGFVIALMAMILDRITYAFATKDRQRSTTTDKRKPLAITLGALAALWLVSLLIPALNTWPEGWVYFPVDTINARFEQFTVDYRTTIEAIKNSAFFYLMLPVKIGFENAVSPFTWGFAMTPLVTGLYTAGALALAAWAFIKGNRYAAAAIILAALIAYIGLTNVPAIALIAIITTCAGFAGGRGLAIGTALGLLFLLIAGIWPEAVLSIYLCGVGVLIAFTLGTTIGIWAAQNKWVSLVVRPIIDTLQTMPLFVILIPFIMIFKIGEFTALLAVIAYAIVPAIRYTEHGLRNLPDHVIEAATTLGATRWQLLTRVKLPLALPAIMLGLNQTIIYGIGMLVITALVGTNGLGQQIYIGLGDGDFGVGMLAGIGMAIIAIIADRMTQAISQRRQKQLGLTSDLI